MLNRLAPSITQSFPSRRATVSSQVASLPWFGSVSPKAMRCSPVIIPSRYFAFCSGVPKAYMMWTRGKLPTIDDSFCRSLWRPSPRAARWSRMTAMARFDPS